MHISWRVCRKGWEERAQGAEELMSDTKRGRWAAVPGGP